MKKALFIGINDYKNIPPLEGCINDATRMATTLAKNGDDSPNFSNRVCTSDRTVISRSLMQKATADLFKGDADTVLFYFAGHGFIDPSDQEGYLVSQDGSPKNWGIKLSDIMEKANKAHPNIKSTIILLDCCHAGIIGEVHALENLVRASLIGNNVSILAACHRSDVATEIEGNGRFTQVLLEGLEGASCDILGRISPANLYAYADQALDPWEQRPVYKANVQQFTNLLCLKPKVDLKIIRKFPMYFATTKDKFQLDPSFEPNRGEETENLSSIPIIQSNVQIYREFQSCYRHDLLVPSEHPHMWHSAIYSGTVELTPLGAHYWRLADNNRL